MILLHYPVPLWRVCPWSLESPAALLLSSVVTLVFETACYLSSSFPSSLKTLSSSHRRCHTHFALPPLLNQTKPLTSLLALPFHLLNAYLQKVASSRSNDVNILARLSLSSLCFVIVVEKRGKMGVVVLRHN